MVTAATGIPQRPFPLPLLQHYDKMSYERYSDMKSPGTISGVFICGDGKTGCCYRMIRKFIGYYRPHLPLFMLDFGCALITALMDLVFPYVVQLMIDDVFPSRNLRLILAISGGLLVFFIVRSILQYIVDYWDMYSGSGWSTICERIYSSISRSYPLITLTIRAPAK